ncbi:MAG: glycosyltransferase family 39 protein [Saprospiraceae bacterium]
MTLLHKIPFPVFLGFLWIMAIIVVNPIGEFPLNDDWAYAKSVFDLVETGEMVMVNWPAMTLVAQIYWGALFCKVAGVSFTILRFSTLISSFIGGLAFYYLARELSRNQRPAAFATLVLFFNPLYFSLSFTFMTDVHFLAAFLLAFLFFSKNIRRPHLVYLALATLFSIVATLIRQPGLLVPFVFMLIGFLTEGKHFKRILLNTIPFLLTLSAFVAYSLWLKLGTSTPNNVQSVKDLLLGIFSNSLGFHFYRSVSVLLYVGFFMLSFLVAFLPAKSKGMSRSMIKQVLLWMGCILVLYLGSVFFPIGNIFYNLGLGPKLLKDAYYGQNISPQLPAWAWMGIKYIGVIATSILLFAIPKKMISLKKAVFGSPLHHLRLVKLALSVTFLAFGSFLVISTYFFDRYTLPLIACAILMVLPYQRKWSKGSYGAGVLLLLFFATFSLSATQHYLAWNRTRWEAVDYLMKEKQVSPEHIDAGFEVNAWYQAGPIHKEDKYGKSWWFVTEDDYVLSFGLLPGFRQEKVMPVKAYWPFHQDSIFILWHMVDGLTLYSDYPISCGAEALSEDGNFYLSSLPQVKFEGHQTQSTEKVHSGQYSMGLTDGKEFGLSTLLKGIQPGDQIRLRVWRWDDSGSAGLVLSAESGGDFYHFETTNVVQQGQNGWQQLELNATIPTDANFDKVGITVWNPGKRNVWFDDLEIWRQAIKE